MGTEREKGVRPSLLSVSTLLNAGVSDALTPVSWGVFARLPVFSFLLQLLAVLVQGPCPCAVLCCAVVDAVWRAGPAARCTDRRDS